LTSRPREETVQELVQAALIGMQQVAVGTSACEVFSACLSLTKHLAGVVCGLHPEARATVQQDLQRLLLECAEGKES